MSSYQAKELIPHEKIDHKIFCLRGVRVILDRDIARLYGVKSIALRQQVKRNIDRFPKDFMVRLTKKEAKFLVSQNVIPSIQSLGGFLPYAFTEQGVAMLSSVLTSKKAVYVSLQIMRAFVRLRAMIATHSELRQKIEKMEKKYDKQFHVVFAAIKELFDKFKEPEKPKRPIGFHVRD